MSDKVTYIKELVEKPSDAINALEDGIKNHYAHGIDSIKMRHYFQVERDKKCFGCAATMSILSILNIKRDVLKDAIKTLPEGFIWKLSGKDKVIGTPADRTAIYMKCKDGLILDKYDIEMFEEVMEEFRIGRYEDLLAFYELYDEYEGFAYKFIPRQNWFLGNDAISDTKAWDNIREYKDQLIALGY